MFTFETDLPVEVSFLIDEMRTNQRTKISVAQIGPRSLASEMTTFLDATDSFTYFDTPEAVSAFGMEELRNCRSLTCLDVAYLADLGTFAETFAAASLTKGMIRLGGAFIIDDRYEPIQSLLLERDPDFIRKKPTKNRSGALVYVMSAAC